MPDGHDRVPLLLGLCGPMCVGTLVFRRVWVVFYCMCMLPLRIYLVPGCDVYCLCIYCVFSLTLRDAVVGLFLVQVVYGTTILASFVHIF